MALRPFLQEIFDKIRAAHPDGLSLDTLGDELVHENVTHADIEELIGALEDAGVALDGPEPPVRPEELFRVLAAARAHLSETGQPPSPEELASRTGLTVATVRRILRFGGSGGGEDGGGEPGVGESRKGGTKLPLKLH